MGGVDLLDSLIGRYKSKMKSRKWYMGLFCHLLDITVINAWLLYRRCNINEAVFNLADFRINLASTLCQTGLRITPKRGRPSQMQHQIDKTVVTRIFQQLSAYIYMILSLIFRQIMRDYSTTYVDLSNGHKMSNNLCLWNIEFCRLSPSTD